MNELTTYSKTLHPADFARLEPEIGFLRDVRRRLADAQVDVGHPCRYWEYAIALRAVLRKRAISVLDVGGGGGLFSPAAACCGSSVLQIDRKDFSEYIAEQEKLLCLNVEGVPGSIRFLQIDLPEWQLKFQAVVCVSVIEHVEEDIAFFEKLLDCVLPGGVLVLTTDFHPSRDRFCDGHLRTYNEERLRVLAMMGENHGFRPWGGEPDWSYVGDHVYQYNFGSLVLVRT